MISIAIAIDLKTGEKFHCVFDNSTGLPVEAIQRFLNHCRKRRLAPNTVAAYAYRLLDFWRWLRLKALYWKELKLIDFGDFIDWYILGSDITIDSREGQELVSKRGPKTVSQAIAAIRGFYSFHDKEGRIKNQQLIQIIAEWRTQSSFPRGRFSSRMSDQINIKLKGAKVFPGCLTDEQVVRLVEGCLTYRDKLMLMLSRDTGVRRGELLGLHFVDVQDIDSTGRIYIVRRNNPNGAWVKGLERTIPILHNLKAIQDVLRAYLLEEYPPQAEQLGHGMLFVNLEGKHIGQPVSLARYSKLFEQLYSRTGIKSYPHLLRHTFATRMLQKGYEDYYVQQLLGHRSISTTRDIYSHVLDELDLYALMRQEDECLLYH